MPFDELMSADDLMIAQRRAEHLAQNGATVIGPSLQAAWVGLSVLFALNVAIISQDSASIFWFLLTAAGTIVSTASWIRARRRHTLLPLAVQDPERPLGVLRKKLRISIRRQIRGREATTPSTAPLVRAMLLWQRRSNRAAILTFVGLGLSLVGLAGATVRVFEGWSLARFILQMIVILTVTVIALTEARRRRRVLTSIESVKTTNSSL
ncbi:hypothetical protein B7R21_18670 [Subtercola boreus]|uniref:Uncharacterized protein n=1 Tax=Subtercola boreus TaxID=120213 RepID=A0A3E0VB38_9MICO|nr:hypothetical protein [Subtercola boreus]RFA06743.1 hypothetical protein B7R21_18670 [Subtercola boreus]